jgi:hypothetical protein
VRVSEPIVLKPSPHLLLVRFRREAAWLEFGGILLTVAIWYWALFRTRSETAAADWDAPWLWWVFAFVPLALLINGYFIRLIGRCLNGDEFSFNSASGTLTHAGRTIARLRDIRKVLVRTFDPPRQRVPDVYSLRLILENESKIDIAVLHRREPIDSLAAQVGGFLGIRVIEEYTQGYTSESVKSLGLTEREFDDRMSSEDKP